MATKEADGPIELPSGEWRQPINEPVSPPPSSSPDLLPFGERGPREFEKSCLLIAEQVAGLRDVRLYGVPGQAQRGIDLVGTTVDGETHTWQIKRFASFDEKDLEAAVTAFATGDLPFAAQRLVVCVSSLAERVQILDALERLKQEQEFEIQLLDQRRLSEMLRKRADLIARVFSQGWADVFALGKSPEPPRQTASDVLGSAVLQGPFVAAGVTPLLMAAGERASEDPLGAAALLDEAATKVEGLGLPAAAVGLRHRQAELLRLGGAAAEATRLLFDVAWRPFADGLPDRGRESLGRLRALAKEDGAPPNASALAAAIEHVDQWLARPTLSLEPLRLLVGRLTNESPNEARVVGLWLAETMLADPSAADRSATERLLSELRTSRDLSNPNDIDLRLRMCGADLSGEWSELVAAARTGDVSRRHAVWILARYGRRLAHTGEGRAATSAYREAMNAAFAADEPALAEPLLRSWWRTEITFAEVLTQQTLDAANLAGDLDTDPRRGLLVRAYDAYEVGMRKRAEGKAPDALRWLKSALRDASVTGALEDERVAGSAIGDLLCDVGEHDAGVPFLVRAGDTDALKVRLPARRWVSPREALDSRLPWVRTAAWAVVARQGQLAPDAEVAELLELAIADMSHEDVAPIGPSVALQAHKAVAALSDVLCDDAATRALALLERFVERTPGRYFFTDDSHVEIIAEVYRTKPHLRHLARPQVVGLLRDPDVGRRMRARLGDPEPEDPELVEALREQAREGSSLAARFLHGLGLDVPELMEWAKNRIDAWLERAPRQPGAWGFGSDIVQVAYYARLVDSERRSKFATTLLQLAQDAGDAERNRADALEALTTLAPALDDAQRSELWSPVVNLCRPTDELSTIDQHLLGGRHPLSTFKIGFPVGVLAATGARTSVALAVTDEQVAASLELVIGLLPATDEPVAAHALAQALAALGQPAGLDLRLLVGSPFPSIRQLVALWWTANLHPSVNEALVTDDDAVVRRVFAERLREAPDSPAVDDLLSRLRSDPIRRVRRAAGAP